MGAPPPPRWDICYWKLNWWTITQPINDDHRYLVMCDDDGWEPGYFDAIRKAPAPVVILPMAGGDRQTRNPHPPGRFRADAGMMRPGMVGFQFAILGHVLKHLSFPNRQDADGHAAEFLTTFFPTVYLPGPCKRFNWLEPGRWHDAPKS